jgi:plastocyanin
MVRKNGSDNRKEPNAIFMALPAISATLVITLGPYSFTEAFAGGGGGRSGISQACNEAICHVNMTGLTFAPDTLKIRPNAVVVWTNTDKIVHTVTSGSPVDEEKDMLFDSDLSSPIAPGEKWEHKFDAAGMFGYYCQFHPRMAGQVIVTGDPILEFPQAAPLMLAAGAALASVIAAIRLKKSRKGDMV